MRKKSNNLSAQKRLPWLPTGRRWKESLTESISQLFTSIVPLSAEVKQSNISYLEIICFAKKRVPKNVLSIAF